MKKRHAVLMLSWEFPPFITGGLGMACYGLVRSLLKLGVRIFLVLPAEARFYFCLEKPEDADLLPQIFINNEKSEKQFTTVEQRLAYYGVSRVTGVYAYGAGKRSLRKRALSESAELRNWVYEDTFLQMNRYTARTLEIAWQLPFDLIHAHDWFTFPAALALRSLTGKPLLCHMHSTEFDRAGENGDPRIYGIEKDALAQSDRVIAVSKYTSSVIEHRYNADPVKIRIIHNAYSMKKSKVSERRIFKDPIVLFLGRITRQKGPEYFLSTAKRVIDMLPNVRFIMAGEGDMEKELIHLSADYGLGTRFLFTGFLHRDEVSMILSTSDIIVMPSVSEPFGIAPLEAMSYGLAAVVAKQSGVAEIVQNAIKVDFWDVDRMAAEIVGLLKNPAKMRRVGELCAKEVQRIGWDEAARRMIGVYEELIC
jgi:glycogen(starch) synthase